MIQFREINYNELQIIRDMLQQVFKIRDCAPLLAQREIIVGVGKWKDVLLVSDNLKKVFLELKEYRNPYFMGVHFGEIKNDAFKISLEGITLFAKYIKEKTILTESGEKRVLYGRDLTKLDIHYIPKKVQKNDLSVLVNDKEEVLALGKYLFNREEIQFIDNNQKIVKNIVDKGWYLRKGK